MFITVLVKTTILLNTRGLTGCDSFIFVFVTPSLQNALSGKMKITKYNKNKRSVLLTRNKKVSSSSVEFGLWDFDWETQIVLRCECKTLPAFCMSEMSWRLVPGGCSAEKKEKINIPKRIESYIVMN